MKLLSATALVLAVSCGVPAAPESGQAPRKFQVVKLSLDDRGYVVTRPTVARGVPVRMEVDVTAVTGCTRTVVIDAFKVKKTVKEGDSAIEFTPTTNGPVQLVCGMNMVRGSFTVVDPQ